jgi:GNAT superfamily N-acetyltransferase
MTTVALPIRVFDPRESHGFARQAAFGGDSDYLAQATRRRLTAWQQAKTIVVAAMANDGTPACWAAFGALALDRTAWRYGNLFTRPEHRRQGLAQAVVSRGLEVARAGGAHRVFCLIATNNHESMAFHGRLGFAATSIRLSRLTIATAVSDSGRDLQLPTLGARELEHTIRSDLPLCGLAAGDATISFVLSNLLPDRPLLPWRRPAATASCMPLGSGAPLYIRYSKDSVTAFGGWRQSRALDSSARAAELTAALQSLARPSCGVFHDEELTAALAPRAHQAFTVSAFKIS